LQVLFAIVPVGLLSAETVPVAIELWNEVVVYWFDLGLSACQTVLGVDEHPLPYYHVPGLFLWLSLV